MWNTGMRQVVEFREDSTLNWSEHVQWLLMANALEVGTSDWIAIKR